MDIEKKYRRLLHAELDELLDSDEKIYSGPMQAMDEEALEERVSRKWAFDEIVRAHSRAKYGKDEIVRSLGVSIDLYKTMISKLDAEAEESGIVAENYRRTIRTIEEFVSKL